MVSGIVLTANENNSTVDAGFHNACTGTLSGNVWNDLDGMTDGVIDSTGTSLLPIPVGVRATLVSLSTGKVIKTSLVVAGKYNFTNIAPGGYYVVLSTQTGVIGNNPPNPKLPSAWINTGERIGLTPGFDGLVDGRLNVIVGNECIININFGIRFGNEDIGFP